MLSSRKRKKKKMNKSSAYLTKWGKKSWFLFYFIFYFLILFYSIILYLTLFYLICGDSDEHPKEDEVPVLGFSSRT